MNDAASPIGQHWTETFPDVVERATALLGIDATTVATHSQVVPGGFHVWVPGRGGAHGVIGFDGSAYVRESTFTQGELVAAFNTGGQRNDATLAERPINHGASAVASMVGVLRGEPARQATPTGPTEQELAELMGAPFHETTPEEIAERLRARGKGHYAIVGIDRPHAPGHWYVAYFDGDAVHALDPIANRRLEWPPTSDAVRWVADGAPTTSPATVVLDTRTRHGRRIWLRTTPRLAPHARVLLDWLATLAPETVKNGLGVWHGFWWASLADDGDDLRIAATDLTKPGITTLTWDVAPMLEAYLVQSEMAAFCKVPRSSVKFAETVWVESVAYDAPEIHVKRYPTTGNDTGWFISQSEHKPRGGSREVPAHEVWRTAPHLVRYLALPVGFHAVWSNGRTSRIWNPAGDLIWDADARDRATQAATTG